MAAGESFSIREKFCWGYKTVYTRKSLLTLTGFIFLGMVGPGLAGTWEYPVIKGYGQVQPMPKAAIQPEKNLHYKVVFDIKTGAKKPDDLNPGLHHMARFINLMALAGIKPESFEVVGVISGHAGPVIFKNDLYRKKFKMDNPNIELIKELKKAGAKIYVCGQLVSEHNYQPEWINPEIEITLSALVAVPTFELQGYALMPF
jgi:predicted peroxiredoxin